MLSSSGQVRISHGGAGLIQLGLTNVSTELEEVLSISTDAPLSRIDNSLRTFTSLCATYHGESRADVGMELGLIYDYTE